MRLFGVTLIGATPENLRKLLLTIAIVIIVLTATWLMRSLLRLFIGTRGGTRFHFWARQAVSLVMAMVLASAMGVVAALPRQAARLDRVAAAGDRRGDPQRVDPEVGEVSLLDLLEDAREVSAAVVRGLEDPGHDPRVDALETALGVPIEGGDEAFGADCRRALG